MVVDTAYYDVLHVQPTATQLEIKTSYRRLAIKLHPDKNPGDAEANQRFQEIGEAYQVLSDTELRKQYDKLGKDKAVPSSGFEDPAELFSTIFGGEAFIDWIGEISLMKDMSKTMEISMREQEAMEAEETATASDSKAADGVPSSSGNHVPPPYEKPPGYQPPSAEETTAAQTEVPPNEKGTAPTENPYSQEKPKGIPIRAAIMSAEEDARLSASGASEAEKELRQKEKKKGGLTREQREELVAFEMERRKIRQERVDTLARKLVDRISLWTETDKGPDVTKAFRAKIRLETENLRLESFGLNILHSIAETYLSKATSFLKSQKFLGISGFWSRVKDKGTLIKDTWDAISTAVDAQKSMEAMAKAEEIGGDEWTDERREEHEKRVTGKLLAAAWRGSRFEIQSVLRDVCDEVLNDKKVRLEKRVERAHAMIIVGEILRDAKRDPEEEGDFMAFEQLMADAAAKKERKDKKADDGSTHNHRHFGFRGDTKEPTPSY